MAEAAHSFRETGEIKIEVQDGEASKLSDPYIKQYWGVFERLGNEYGFENVIIDRQVEEGYAQGAHSKKEIEDFIRKRLRLEPRSATGPVFSAKTERIQDQEQQELSKKIEIHGAEFLGTTLELETLKQEGLLPQHKIELAPNVTVFISDPYDLGHGRVACVGYIQKDGKTVARSFWRSNSQGVWRYLPEYTVKDYEIDWFGKGFGEESVLLPFALQKELAKITQDEKRIKQIKNTQLVFAGTASEYKEGTTYRQSIESTPTRLEGNFYGRPGTKNPPEQVDFKNPEQRPDFSRTLDSWQQNTSLYGPVQMEVYPSQDGKLKYLFCRDQKGQTWVGGIEDSSEIQTVGLRKTWYQAGDLTTPAFEYKIGDTDQTGGYGNDQLRQGPYVDMFDKYLQKIPVIQEYLQAKAGKEQQDQDEAKEKYPQTLAFFREYINADFQEDLHKAKESKDEKKIAELEKIERGVTKILDALTKGDTSLAVFKLKDMLRINQDLAKAGQDRQKTIQEISELLQELGEGTPKAENSKDLEELLTDLEQKRTAYLEARRQRGKIFRRGQFAGEKGKEALQKIAQEYQEARSAYFRQKVTAELKDQNLSPEQASAQITTALLNAYAQENTRMEEALGQKDQGRYQNFKKWWQKHSKARIGAGLGLSVLSFGSVFMPGGSAIGTAANIGRGVLSGTSTTVGLESLLERYSKSMGERGLINDLGKLSREQKKELKKIKDKQERATAKGKLFTENVRAKIKNYTPEQFASTLGPELARLAALAERKGVKTEQVGQYGNVVLALREQQQKILAQKINQALEKGEKDPADLLKRALNESLDIQLQAMDKSVEEAGEIERKKAIKRWVVSLTAGAVMGSLTAFLGLRRMAKAQEAHEAITTPGFEQPVPLTPKPEMATPLKPMVPKPPAPETPEFLKPPLVEETLPERPLVFRPQDEIDFTPKAPEGGLAQPEVIHPEIPAPKPPSGEPVPLEDVIGPEQAQPDVAEVASDLPPTEGPDSTTPDLTPETPTGEAEIPVTEVKPDTTPEITPETQTPTVEVSSGTLEAIDYQVEISTQEFSDLITELRTTRPLDQILAEIGELSENRDELANVHAINQILEDNLRDLSSISGDEIRDKTFTTIAQTNAAIIEKAETEIGERLAALGEKFSKEKAFLQVMRETVIAGLKDRIEE